MIRLLVAAVLGLGTLAMGRVHVHTEGSQVSYSFEFSPPRQTPLALGSRSFVALSLEEEAGYLGLLYETGRPRLPVIRFPILGEGEIRVEPGESRQELTLNHPVVPVAPPRSRSGGRREPPQGEPSLYGSDRLYPPQLYQVEEAGRVGFRRRRLVTLYPLRYRPAVGKVEFVREFRVHHFGEPRTWAAGNRGFEAMAVVVGRKFRDSRVLREFQVFKKGLGYEVIPVDVPEDADNTAAALRDRLRQWYERKKGTLGYVLLVGDVDEVPGYDSEAVAGVTDHYYACLDEADYAGDLSSPDVAVGRISAGTEAELETILRKHIRYETGDFKDGSWLTRASLVATDDSYYFPIAEGTLQFLRLNYLVELGYTGSFPKAPAEGGDLLFAAGHGATGDDVLRAANEGRGIIAYGGHGEVDRWLGPEFSGAHIDQLSHREALPLVMSHACHTGNFSEASFAEHWQRHPRGAIGVWAATDADYWNEGEYSQRRYYEAIFRWGEYALGRAGNRSRMDTHRYLGTHWYADFYQELYNFFGDPSLELRTAEPRPIRLTLPARLPSRDRSVEVAVLDLDDKPMAEVKVAVLGADDRLLAVGRTDAEGKATLSLPEVRATPLRVVASGRHVRLASAGIPGQ